MFTKIVVGALLALGAQSAALANATIPTKDIAGAKDNPAIKRYEGSFIVSYQRETFTDFKVPLSSLEPTERRDGMNNRLHLPKKEMELEGAKTTTGLSHSRRALAAGGIEELRGCREGRRR